MYFDFMFDDNAELDNLIIRPDENEDPDVLNYYSKILNIRNPAIRFAELAKMGKFNYYNEQDYSIMLNSIKEFEDLFFKKQLKVNIFQLLADMTEYILANYCFLPHVDNNENGNKTDSFDSPWD